MTDSVRVDFHCHSACSDGALPPEGVAHMLAGAGVRCAALTDHDTVEGTARFAEALARRGITSLAGMELSASHALGEIHLLALGFRPAALRMGRSRPAPLRRAIRSVWAGRPGAAPPEASGNTAADLISRVHEAGGRTYLAHPLLPVSDLGALEPLLEELKAAGLDGIEALYKPYPRATRSRLARLAGRLDLLVVAGSDYHGDGANGAAQPGCNLPRWHWERFCRAHDLVAAHREEAAPPDRAGKETPS